MFKVSHMRDDGGVGELTLYGYGAEGNALNIATQLEKNPHIIVVLVIARHIISKPGYPDDVEWEVIRKYEG